MHKYCRKLPKNVIGGVLTHPTLMKPAKKKSPEPRKARTGEKHRTAGTLKSTAANKCQKEDKADCCCLVCAELWSTSQPGEKWIQCQNCKNWPPDLICVTFVEFYYVHHSGP